jgi:hypothetical protein
MDIQHSGHTLPVDVALWAFPMNLDVSKDSRASKDSAKVRKSVWILRAIFVFNVKNVLPYTNRSEPSATTRLCNGLLASRRSMSWRSGI